MKNEWGKKIKKRTDNIGFISRSNAFRDPSPAEISAAMAKEIESWQATKGKKTYRLSADYSIPKGYGINLKADQYYESRIHATYAYINTPMDAGNVDVTPYTNPKTRFQKIKDWFKTFTKLPKRMSYMEIQEYFSREKK